MATPHISAPEGAFAKTVLMPGDPLRAKFIAETFPEEAPTFNWMGKAPFRGDKYLAGTMISDVRIYDRALSEEEIEKL